MAWAGWKNQWKNLIFTFLYCFWPKQWEKVVPKVKFLVWEESTFLGQSTHYAYMTIEIMVSKYIWMTKRLIVNKSWELAWGLKTRTGQKDTPPPPPRWHRHSRAHTANSYSLITVPLHKRIVIIIDRLNDLWVGLFFHKNYDQKI